VKIGASVKGRDVRGKKRSKTLGENANAITPVRSARMGSNHEDRLQTLIPIPQRSQNDSRTFKRGGWGRAVWKKREHEDKEERGNIVINF